MRRLSLGTTLAGANAVLVLAAVAGAGLAGVVALRRLADEQALARLALAGAAVEQELVSEEARLLTAARLLAQRPTLQRLVDEQRTAELAAFLRDFAVTGELAGAAVVGNGGKDVIASSGDLDWDALRALPSGRHSARAADGTAVPLLISRTTVARDAAIEVVAARLLDAQLASRVSSIIGLPVSFVTPPTGTDETLAVSRTQRRADAYVDLRLARDLDGAPLLGLETRLGAATVDASLRRLTRRLLLGALAAAVFALVAGLWLSRRVARPLTRLGDAARRLGRGDLRTPVASLGAGEVEELASTLEDSRRRLLELTTELRQREAEARALLEGIVEGVYAVDDARRITYVSPQAAVSLRIEPAAAIGRFCGEVLRPVAQDGKLPCQDDCPIVHARSRGSARAVELVHGASREPRRLAITSSPSVDGRQVQVLREETPEEVNRRLRDNILANLSHELRTPLAAQLASIELLGDGLEALPPAQSRELVAALERSTVRLTRLVDNLLTSVRIESGTWPARFAPVDVGEVARDAASVLAPLLRQRRQRLSVEIPPDLPAVRADRTQLTHALLNLLANANRFAPDDTTITVAAGLGADGVAVRVEDEGPGLPDTSGEAAPRDLFEQWSQPTDGSSVHGVGLGLSIVRAVVERHHGSILAETRAQGGARFTLTIPAYSETAVPAHAVSP